MMTDGEGAIQHSGLVFTSMSLNTILHTYIRMIHVSWVDIEISFTAFNRYMRTPINDQSPRLVEDRTMSYSCLTCHRLYNHIILTCIYVMVIGVPCGGLGGGCIGRGYRGDFRRWSLFPGRYSHRIVYTDQFSIRVKRLGSNKIYATVLSVVKPAQDDVHIPCRFWNWNMNPSCATYHAVFPR